MGEKREVQRLKRKTRVEGQPVFSLARAVFGKKRKRKKRRA